MTTSEKLNSNNSNIKSKSMDMKSSFANWFLEIPEAKIGTLQRVPLERTKHVGQENTEYKQPPVEVVFDYVDDNYVFPKQKQWKEFKTNASEASVPK